MIGSNPNVWEVSRRAKRRALEIGAFVVLVCALASILPVAALSAAFALYAAANAAACHAARSC